MRGLQRPRLLEQRSIAASGSNSLYQRLRSLGRPERRGSSLNTVRLGRYLNHFSERYRNADDGEKRLNLTVLGQVLRDNICSSRYSVWNRMRAQ